jgi:hypothetical protein
MTTHKTIYAKTHPWLRRSVFVFLLLVSLYSLSRTVHKTSRTNLNDSHVLIPAANPADNSLAALPFYDNRGNIECEKNQFRPGKNSRQSEAKKLHH